MNSETPPTAVSRRSIAATGGFAHFVHDGMTSSLYVLLPLWAVEFHLSQTEVGFVKMAAMVALSAFQIPAGLLAERIGNRSVLAVGTVFAGIGFVGIGLAGGLLSLLVWVIISNAASSVQHPLASAIVSDAFAAGGRRAAMGTYNFAGDLGKVAMPAAVAALVAAVGWRQGVMAGGAAAALGGVVIFVVLRTFGAAEAARVQTRPGADQKPGWGIADNRGFSVLSTMSIIDIGVRGAFLTFLPFLLMERGAELESVGFALGLVFAGGACGKLVCGFIAERVGILRTVVLVQIAAVSALALIITMPLQVILVLLLPAGIALHGSSSVLYGTVAEFVDADRQARAFGLFYTLGIGIGGMSPIFFGFISDTSGVTDSFVIMAALSAALIVLMFILRPSLVRTAPAGSS